MKSETIEIRPYFRGDCEALSAAGADLPPMLLASTEDSFMATPFAFTAVIDGRPRGSAALVRMWPGLAILSAVVTPMPARLWVRLRPEIRARLDAFQDEGDDFARIEATVDAAVPSHAAFLRALGFEIHERPLKRYFNNRAFLLADRVKEGGL